MTDVVDTMKTLARSFDDVEEGTSCSQTAFKTKGKAFFYIGDQGGRHKAMFKLEGSRAEAARLSEAEPKNFELGSGAWVTARFSPEEPLPAKLWEKWLVESYELSV